MEQTISLEWSKKMLAAEEGITPAAGSLAMRPFSDSDNTDTMRTKMLAAEEGITPAAGPLAMRPFSDSDNTDTMLR